MSVTLAGAFRIRKRSFPGRKEGRQTCLHKGVCLYDRPSTVDLAAAHRRQLERRHSKMANEYVEVSSLDDAEDRASETMTSKKRQRLLEKNWSGKIPQVGAVYKAQRTTDSSSATTRVVYVIILESEEPQQATQPARAPGAFDRQNRLAQLHDLIKLITSKSKLTHEVVMVFFKKFNNIIEDVQNEQHIPKVGVIMMMCPEPWHVAMPDHEANFATGGRIQSFTFNDISSAGTRLDPVRERYYLLDRQWTPKEKSIVVAEEVAKGDVASKLFIEGVIKLGLMNPDILMTQGWLASAAPISITQHFAFCAEALHGSGRFTPLGRRLLAQHHAHWICGERAAPGGLDYLTSLRTMLNRSPVAPASARLLHRTIGSRLQLVDIRASGAWRQLLQTIELRDFFDGAPAPAALACSTCPCSALASACSSCWPSCSLRRFLPACLPSRA